jgi:hypothetical protein
MLLYVLTLLYRCVCVCVCVWNTLVQVCLCLCLCLCLVLFLCQCACTHSYPSTRTHTQFKCVYTSHNVTQTYWAHHTHTTHPPTHPHTHIPTHPHTHTHTLTGTQAGRGSHGNSCRRLHFTTIKEIVRGAPRTCLGFRFWVQVLGFRVQAPRQQRCRCSNLPDLQK